MKYFCRYDFPIGPLWLAEAQEMLTNVVFTFTELGLENGEEKKTPLLEKVIKQLEEYFCGERACFKLPISLRGTEFQQRVWRELQRIPYGQTRSYGELATQLGNPRGARAVGAANGRNPISIIVPCHRLVGQNGKLTGYAGGLRIKQFLLELERNHV